ncbi:MAG: universal stress protein, partial [Desulfobacterales bacterium]
MIPEINKILYATDLSENARYAFSYAASLANRYGAGITILHVLEEISPTTDNLVVGILGREKWNELRGKNEKEVLATLKSRLTRFCEDVQAELPSCPFITDKIKVTIGKPV